MKKIQIYDTTLRDGSQCEGISFSVQDKLLIARKLDELGFDFIEGGWPGANPKDIEFFDQIKKVKLRTARIVAFGSTRRAGSKASDDTNLKGLLAAETGVITIFGKSWDFHVTEVFRTNLDENLRMIEDSVRHLKSKGREVVYDAEHFFDGYLANPEYALKTLEAAASAGAAVIVLCDTNGGTMPSAVGKITREVAARLSHPLGIHTHNDSGVAVANALAAVEAGAVQVQGTVNGIGERCGNADLVPIVANLELKLGFTCLPEGALAALTEAARYVSEVSNRAQFGGQPYVGRSAFAHKGGVHIDAVKKNSRTYEHIDPALVGNRHRNLVSELGGKTNVVLKAREFDIELEKDSPETRQVLEEIQKLENEGYQYEGAEASFELLLRKRINKTKPFFEARGSVSSENIGDKDTSVKASVKVSVDGRTREAEKKGDGPVDALGKALHEALVHFYPQVKGLRLDDYKVRIVDSKAGTAARVRVLIEFVDEKARRWTTIGVSTNIIDASWLAIVDAYNYKLLKEKV